MAEILVNNFQPKGSTSNHMDTGLLAVCPPSIREAVSGMPVEFTAKLQEIRLRLGGPLYVQSWNSGYFLDASGRLLDRPEEAYGVTAGDLERVFQNITRSSVYALEEEMRSGFITVPGGHRVGFTGEAVVVDGSLKGLKNISCLNIRVCRQIQGCAGKLLPLLITSNKTVYHTLIISPPKCGKTTLLRDIVRQLSSGIASLGFAGVNVAVVDERSEIAASYLGRPQLDVGYRTDVLDKCPKSQGMYLLVRSMSPEVIATDELGKPEDASAVQDVLNAGIKLITTVHGSGVDDIRRRPVLNELLEQGLFERLVVLGRSKGVGTIETVVNGLSGKRLL